MLQVKITAFFLCYSHNRKSTSASARKSLNSHMANLSLHPLYYKADWEASSNLLYGVDGETWTRKDFSTRPSNVRVYQFRHADILQVILNCQNFCSLYGGSTFFQKVPSRSNWHLVNSRSAECHADINLVFNNKQINITIIKTQVVVNFYSCYCNFFCEW